MSDWGGRLTNYFVRPLSPILVETPELQPLAIVGLVVYDTAVPSVSFLLFSNRRDRNPSMYSVWSLHTQADLIQNRSQETQSGNTRSSGVKSVQ